MMEHNDRINTNKASHKGMAYIVQLAIKVPFQVDLDDGAF
jgi:hypothetical protein